MALRHGLVRGGAKSAVAALILEIPRLFGLLYRLMRDRRVSRVDKALVFGVLAYVATPADLLPDFLGFLGLVDDLYLVALMLDRLLVGAGWDLLEEHWRGSPRTLRAVVDGLDEIGGFVPAPIRAVLRGKVRRRRPGPPSRTPA